MFWQDKRRLYSPHGQQMTDNPLFLSVSSEIVYWGSEIPIDSCWISALNCWTETDDARKHTGKDVHYSIHNTISAFVLISWYCFHSVFLSLVTILWCEVKASCSSPVCITDMSWLTDWLTDCGHLNFQLVSALRWNSASCSTLQYVLQSVPVQHGEGRSFSCFLTLSSAVSTQSSYLFVWLCFKP